MTRIVCYRWTVTPFKEIKIVYRVKKENVSTLFSFLCYIKVIIVRRVVAFFSYMLTPEKREFKQVVSQPQTSNYNVIPNAMSPYWHKDCPRYLLAHYLFFFFFNTFSLSLSLFTTSNEYHTTRLSSILNCTYGVCFLNVKLSGGILHWNNRRQFFPAQVKRSCFSNNSDILMNDNNVT